MQVVQQPPSGHRPQTLAVFLSHFTQLPIILAWSWFHWFEHVQFGVAAWTTISFWLRTFIIISGTLATCRRKVNFHHHIFAYERAFGSAMPSLCKYCANTSWADAHYHRPVSAAIRAVWQPETTIGTISAADLSVEQLQFQNECKCPCSVNVQIGGWCEVQRKSVDIFEYSWILID